VGFFCGGDGETAELRSKEIREADFRSVAGRRQRTAEAPRGVSDKVGSIPTISTKQCKSELKEFGFCFLCSTKSE